MANNERVQDEGEKIINVKDENGQRKRMKGRVAAIYKPLVAASGVCKHGQDIYLGAAGGYMIRGRIQKEMRKHFKYLINKYGMADCVPVYQEGGVYNFYVNRVDGSAEKELCPNEVDSGFPRQGYP